MNHVVRPSVSQPLPPDVGKNKLHDRIAMIFKEEPMFTIGRRGFIAGLLLIPGMERLLGRAPVIAKLPMKDRGLCPECASALTEYYAGLGDDTTGGAYWGIMDRLLEKGTRNASVSALDRMCGRCWPKPSIAWPDGIENDPEIIEALAMDRRRRVTMYSRELPQ